MASINARNLPAIIALTLTLSACGREDHVGYRVELSVTSNGRIYRDSGNIDFDVWTPPDSIRLIQRGSVVVRGEPPVLELPGGRIVSTTYLCTSDFDFVKTELNEGAQWNGKLPFQNGLAFPCEGPLLVTFGNKFDPLTVKAVDINSPASSLGADVQSVRVTASPASVPPPPLALFWPSYGKMKKLLPWLGRTKV